MASGYNGFVSIPAKLSPAGIKPFLCLKGKLNCKKGAKSSPKKIVSIKAKIKKFESKSKSDVECPEVTENKSNCSRITNPSVGQKKVKKMLEIFEMGHAQEVVHAPNSELNASENEFNNSEAKSTDVFRVKNAFEVLMASGGKTPIKKVKRLRSTKK